MGQFPTPLADLLWSDFPPDVLDGADVWPDLAEDGRVTEGVGSSIAPLTVIKGVVLSRRCLPRVRTSIYCFRCHFPQVAIRFFSIVGACPWGIGTAIPAPGIFKIAASMVVLD